MLIIFCAELEEAKHIKHPNAKIIITGAGLCNVIQTPILNVRPTDQLINIGYAGSNLYPVGEVRTVRQCRRLIPSKTVKEKDVIINPLKEIAGAGCYTADNFIERNETKKEIPLVDMELYYLASIYPQVQTIKIISDNLNYKNYKKCELQKSWDFVNDILETIDNENN